MLCVRFNVLGSIAGAGRVGTISSEIRDDQMQIQPAQHRTRVANLGPWPQHPTDKGTFVASTTHFIAALYIRPHGCVNVVTLSSLPRPRLRLVRGTRAR